MALSQSAIGSPIAHCFKYDSSFNDYTTLLGHGLQVNYIMNIRCGEDIASVQSLCALLLDFQTMDRYSLLQCRWDEILLYAILVGINKCAM